MRTLRIWVAIVAFWCGAAHAQAPRLEFKGLVLGEATEAQVREMYADADRSNGAASTLYVTALPRSGAAGFSLPGGYRTDMIAFEWIEPKEFGQTRRLGAVRFQLGISAFPAMRDALSLKFGEPTKREPQLFRTGGGPALETYALVWTLADGVIRLRERSGKLTEAGIEFYTPEVVEQREERRRKTAEDGVKAL